MSHVASQLRRHWPNRCCWYPKDWSSSRLTLLRKPATGRIGTVVSWLQQITISSSCLVCLSVSFTVCWYRGKGGNIQLTVLRLTLDAGGGGLFMAGCEGNATRNLRLNAMRCAHSRTTSSNSGWLGEHHSQASTLACHTVQANESQSRKESKRKSHQPLCISLPGQFLISRGWEAQSIRTLGESRRYTA